MTFQYQFNFEYFYNNFSMLRSVSLLNILFHNWPESQANLCTTAAIYQTESEPFKMAAPVPQTPHDGTTVKLTNISLFLYSQLVSDVTCNRRSVV